MAEEKRPPFESDRREGSILDSAGTSWNIIYVREYLPDSNIEIVKLKRSNEVPTERQGCESSIRDYNDNFEVFEGTVIPLAMGLYLSRFASADFATLKEKLINVLQAPPADDGVLLTEILDKKIISSNFDIQLPEEYTATLDASYIKSLEDRYKVIIDERLKPDLDGVHDSEYRLPQVDGSDDIYRPGFLNDFTRLEVDCGGGDFTLYYSCCDIIQCHADALVNSTTPNISFDGGISGYIGEKGGQKMMQECADNISEYGPLTTGEVYASRPGELSDYKNIIHVASPQWDEHGGDFEENDFLVQAIIAILAEADRLRLRNVGMPAISAGGFGFPLEVSLLSIFTGIKAYFEGRAALGKSGMLKYVHLVDHNPDVIQEIKDAMEKVYGADQVLDEHEKQYKNETTVSYVIRGGSREQVGVVLSVLLAKCRGVLGKISDVPATWSPMHVTEPYRLDEILHNSTDFMQLKAVFLQHLKEVEIVKIERIQNRKLYQDMLDHKRTITGDMGEWKLDYEQKVWHGTTKYGADNIKKDGFSLKYIGKEFVSDFGKGLYFGHTPWVGHFYACDKDDSSGLMYMFRCTAMVGRMYNFDDGYDEADTKAPDGYHSVYKIRTDDVTEFVIFRDTQVYPDYLISYKRKV